MLTNFSRHRHRKAALPFEIDMMSKDRRFRRCIRVRHLLLRLWGFAKVRYRGLAKNANRAFAMLAMLNIKQWGRSLTGEVCPA